MRYRCLLCGLPAAATDLCLRRTRGELGALRQHAVQEHDVPAAALEAARMERGEEGRVVWRLADGTEWAEAE